MISEALINAIHERAMEIWAARLKNASSDDPWEDFIARKDQDKGGDDMGNERVVLPATADPAKEENKFKNIEVGMERKGTKIVLPSEPFQMTYDEAIECLERRKKEEETKISVYEIVDAFPFDGAVAFMNALKEIYGWASPVPRPGFFGPTPPVTVSIEIGPEKYTQIIWGDFKIPGIEGALSTSITEKDGRLVFKIGGSVKKKHQAEVQKIADLTRQLVKTSSIYRGKAIRLKTDDDGAILTEEAPKFIDVTKVNAEELTFSEQVMAEIDTNLFTPIEHTAECRKLQVPLKRGVLLEGPYGTGKTLTAFVTAQKCEQNGWTFILLDRVAGLGDALQLARLYSPAVVFAEDIDRAVSGERSVEMDDVLNTIDGIESKGSEIITILTSNHVKDINQAMLRPGRLDAVISVHAPDAAAAEKLVRIYSRGLLEKDSDLTEAGKELSGRIPAVIRETVERAKLYAIRRAPSVDAVRVTGNDLVHAARQMKNHLALLEPKQMEETVEKKFTDSFRVLVNEGVKSNGVYSAVENIQTKVERIESRVC